MQEYKLISKKGEGTFSEVLKAQSIKTNNFAAIKCMKTHFTSKEQVNELREIQALQKLSPHPNIVRLLEVLYDEPTGRLALVFELMEMNLYELIKDKKTPLPQTKVKHYIYQLIKAIDHMHKKGIFHRDIKPENVLISGETVKLADLGSCRGTYSAHPYTEYISTRWYRPPECLMTDGYYDHKMDIWGAGCVMFEVMTLVPLFPGSNELDMIHRIHNVLGTPNTRVLERLKRHATHIEFNFPERPGTGLEPLMPHASRECIDLIKLMLAYDSEERITADQVLRHDYFKDLWEAERQRDFQNSLTSVRLSPRVNQFTQAHLFEHDRSVPTLRSVYSDHEKSLDYSQSMKKSTLKKNKSIVDQKGFPNLNMSLKVESIFKPSPCSFADTPTDDDFKKVSTLPPLKHSLLYGSESMKLPMINNTNHVVNPKKKDDSNKKYANTLLKPSLSNQSLFKKSKKASMIYRTPEYNLMGKKMV